MTSYEDFSPVGRPVSVVRPFTFDLHEGQIFTAELKDAANELIMFGKPSSEKVEVMGNLTKRSRRVGNTVLRVAYSEEGDSRNSFINLKETVDGNQSITQFVLDPNREEWRVIEDIEKKHDEGRQIYLSSADLVAHLDTKFQSLDRPNVLGPLLDRAHIDPILIPHMLANYLYTTARTKNKVSTFTLDNPMVQGFSAIDQSTDYSFVAPREIRLDVQERNNRTFHKIETGTSFYLGNKTTVDLKYSYAAASIGAEVRQEEGLVTLSSYDGFTETSLRRYAEGDVTQGGQLSVLSTALEALNAQASHRNRAA